MNRPSDEEILSLARRLVESWESIERRVDEMAQKLAAHGWDDGMRDVTIAGMREMLGGEEIYLASKAFLEGT